MPFLSLLSIFLHNFVCYIWLAFVVDDFGGWCWRRVAYDWACTLEWLQSCRLRNAFLFVHCGHGHCAFFEGWSRFLSHSIRRTTKKDNKLYSFILGVLLAAYTQPSCCCQEGDSENSKTPVLGPPITRLVLSFFSTFLSFCFILIPSLSTLYILVLAFTKKWTEHILVSFIAYLLS